MYKKLLALSTFCGTIIGVGLFGLPYVASKIGFVPIILYFIIVGSVAIIIHLIFGEVVQRTKGLHRLPGYAEIYLGKKWKIFSSASGVVGIAGSILAYIIVGGKFLSDLFRPYLGGTESFYLIVYFSLGMLLVYLGSKSISKTELIMLFLFFVITIFLLIKSIGSINYSFLSGFRPQYLFLPYGVIMFSLWGASVIPETSEILGAKFEKSLKNIITGGIIISTATYLIFIFSVLGVTGIHTTSEALTGLIARFGDGIASLALMFGILTTFTSFLTLGITLKKIFWYDLKISHFNSWLLVAAIPAGLYILGFTNFIAIISFVGTITLGFDTITTILCYKKAKVKCDKKPSYSLTLHPRMIYILTGLFLLGIGLEIFDLITQA